MQPNDGKNSSDVTGRPDAGAADESKALRRAKPGEKDIADLDHGHDDGPLDSIGKAITTPVKDAAEEDDV